MSQTAAAVGASPAPARVPPGLPRTPGRSFWTWLPNVFSLLVIALLAINYFYPFGDLDFGILIRIGEKIVQTGQLRPPESFTYTMPGHDVPDYEWLYEIGLWAVWNTFGFGGLKLLKTLSVAAPLVLLGWHLRREKVRWHGIALAEIAAIMVLTTVWNLRPLFITTLSLLLVTTWLHEHCTGRRPLSWWLPVVMFLWANVHPGVILGQALLGGAIAWEWLNHRLQLNPPLDCSACRRLTYIGGLGLAVTLLSPDPLGRMLCPFRPEVAHPIMRIFTEMQPLHHFVCQSPFTAWIAYVVAALVGVTLVFHFRGYRLWEVALLVGLGLLASKAFRSLQDWLLVMLLLGVPHLAALLGEWARHGRRRWWVALLLRTDRSCKVMLNTPLLRFQWFWAAVALALLTAVSLVPPLGRNMPVRDARDWPAPAVDWLENRELATGPAAHFFGPPDYGTYLTWRLGDRVKTYVDTRGFIFPPELLADGHYIPQLGPDWRARLDRILNESAPDRRTDYVLLETTGPRGRLWNEVLHPHITNPLYLDDQTVLLSKQQVQAALSSVQ